MLFRPHTEKYVLGIRLPFTPGLIPKRRSILAKRVGQTISRHLLTDETLAESLCGGDFKRNVNDLLDAFFNEVKHSDITLGGIFELTDVSSVDMRIGISENAGDLAEWLAKTVESSFFEENIKPVVIGIITQNVKGLASLFVVPESIYGNFRGNIVKYLRNTDNHDEIGEKLVALYDRLSVSVKVSDLSSKIGGSYFETLKCVLMSKYDDAVKSNFPALFSALGLAEIIECKINEFEMEEAEEIIVSVVDRELRAITYLGGLLGFIIGLAPPILQSLGIN